MPGVTRFEDLVVWQKACRLAAEVHRTCEIGRAARDDPLVDQLRRAAVSIVSNIAEGFERKRPSAFAQFLEYARGSCAEVRAQLCLAKDTGWMPPNEFRRLMELAEEVGRLLGAIHAAQRRRS